MHPSIESYIARFEAEALRKGSYRSRIGHNERAFLEQVWGPEFDYKFDGLTAEYPLKDYRGGDRFADFAYVRGSFKLLIEIDDFSSHAKDISPGDFGDHLIRQNDLVLAGWKVLRFSSFHIRKSPMVCRGQLKQAIGDWWVRTQLDNPFRRGDRVATFRNMLIELAYRVDAPLKSSDVSRAFEISRPTAMRWLQRFAAEGVFIPVKGRRKVVGYRLNREYAGGPL